MSADLKNNKQKIKTGFVGYLPCKVKPDKTLGGIYDW